MRTFKTGATRNSDDGKPDYEGYVSPLVVHRFGQYMTRHRVQADGNVRASDNWQKGIPLDQYMKSLMRHVQELHLLHRGYQPELIDEEEYRDVENVLSAIIFNAQGYLHEYLRAKLLSADDTAMTATEVIQSKARDKPVNSLPYTYKTLDAPKDDPDREEIKALLRAKLDHLKEEGLIDPNTEIVFSS